MKPTSVFRYRACWLLFCLVAIAATAGCGKSEPARFRLNMVEMETNEISPDHQEAIASILESMFGTPDDPFVLPESGLDITKLRLAAGPAYNDEQGTAHGLFRLHCVHCHGVSGDGAGPTAVFLNPYPRDYRQGKFKFKSTERAALPTVEDMQRILTDGIPGTAMPSFRVLPEKEIDALVEYVRYLSMRGQAETALAQFVFLEVDADQPIPITRDLLVDNILLPIAKKWQNAANEVIQVDVATAPSPDRTPEEKLASIAKGRELFFTEQAACSECHGPTAMGDGQTTDFDDWNKTLDDFKKDHEEFNLAALGVLPVRNAKPRNLRLGVYRGGRRPLDLYYRVHAGINGTPMPGAAETLSPEQIWNLVDFVLSIPYELINQPPEVLINQRERN